MTNRPDTHEHEASTPAELRGIEARLERLAEADRLAASAGFEERIASAARRGAAERTCALRFPSGLRATQWRLAAAAAVAALGGLATIGWLTTHRGPGAPTGVAALNTEAIRADLDMLLASIEGLMEEELADTASPADDSFWYGNSEDAIFFEESM